MSKLVSSLTTYLVLPSLLILCSASWSVEIDGQQLFEKRCAACHKLPDPAQPPPVGWEQQLELMGPLARLKSAQKQEVLGYLLAHSRNASMDATLDEDRMFFEEKCSHCHTLDRILLSQINGEDLQHVVSRMQSRSGPDWLSDDDVRRVLAYLGAAPRNSEPAKPMGNGASPAKIFSTRCSACHTLERIFQKLDASENPADFWSHTVSRMRGKAPQWMPESEASRILEYLQSVAVLRQSRSQSVNP